MATFLLPPPVFTWPSLLTRTPVVPMTSSCLITSAQTLLPIRPHSQVPKVSTSASLFGGTVQPIAYVTFISIKLLFFSKVLSYKIQRERERKNTGHGREREPDRLWAALTGAPKNGSGNNDTTVLRPPQGSPLCACPPALSPPSHRPVTCPRPQLVK